MGNLRKFFRVLMLARVTRPRPTSPQGMGSHRSNAQLGQSFLAQTVTTVTICCPSPFLPPDIVKNTGSLIWEFGTMGFRLKAFAWHLFGSTCALGVTLGLMYLGWYHWPGWYLADMPAVLTIMVGVDVVLGPLLTAIIASRAKPRRTLARDVGFIVLVQVVAFTYGVITLWHARPLYYAFSENCLTLVQAQDIDPGASAAARAHHSAFAPAWYSFPRWIWAPLPKDSAEADKIIESAVEGGYDVTALPQFYMPWASGAPELRNRLQRVDEIKFFSSKEKRLLKERLQAKGFAPDQANGIALTGRKRPLLAVFDRTNLQLLAYISPN
jgi:hypothetical protein